MKRKSLHLEKIYQRVLYQIYNYNSIIEFHTMNIHALCVHACTHGTSGERRLEAAITMEVEQEAKVMASSMASSMPTTRLRTQSIGISSNMFQLKNDSSFVDECASSINTTNGYAGHVRQCWRQKRIAKEAAKLYSAIDEVLATPNTSLVWWAAAVELRSTGVCLTFEHEDEPAMDVKLASVMRHRRLSYNVYWAWFMIVATPLFQLVLVVLVLSYQLFADRFDEDMPYRSLVAHMCIDVDDDFVFTTPGKTIIAISFASSCILFYLGLMQLHLGSMEWRVISFIGSLSYDPVSNELLLAGTCQELQLMRIPCARAFMECAPAHAYLHRLGSQPSSSKGSRDC